MAWCIQVTIPKGASLEKAGTLLRGAELVGDIPAEVTDEASAACEKGIQSVLTLIESGVVGRLSDAPLIVSIAGRTNDNFEPANALTLNIAQPPKP